MSVPNFNFLVCLELATLVRLTRLARLTRLVSPHSITQNVLDMVGYGWIWLELH